MKNFLLPFLLLFPIFSFGQGIDWPDQVEVGSLLVLDGPKGAECIWGITGSDIDGDEYEPTWREFPNAIAIETRYGGLISINLKTDAKRGLTNIQWGILIGEGTDPDPPPPPPPGKIFAVVVEETGNRADLTPEQVQAMISMKDHEYMKNKGYAYYKVDKDVVEPDGQGGDRVPLNIASFLQRAKGQQLPRLIIGNQTGAVLHDDVIVNEDSLLETLKRFGGE